MTTDGSSKCVSSSICPEGVSLEEIEEEGSCEDPQAAIVNRAASSNGKYFFTMLPYAKMRIPF